MNLPTISVPKILTVFGLTACSGLAATVAGNSDVQAFWLGLPIIINSVNALVGSYLGKHVGDDNPLLSEKFANVENEDLEKCSLDAILKALILTVRQLSDCPEAQQLPSGHRILVEEFVKRLERDLQWRLDRVSEEAALTGQLNSAKGSDVFWAVLAGPVGADKLDKEQIRDALTNYALTFFDQRQKAEIYFPWLNQMLSKGFQFSGKHVHWFDLYCHALIDNLKREKPDYCQRANTFIQGKGISTILLQQQAQHIELKKLVDWANTQQQQYAQLVQLLTDFTKPRSPQPALRALKLHDTNEGNNHYRSRWVDMVGRDKEMAEMETFLTSNEPFSWWAVTGPGGMGKSRLALETCLHYGYPQHGQIPNWEAGFILDDAALEIANGFDWREWQPNRPHLIVVDYVVGREELVQKMLLRLGQRGTLTHPVRVLLLERDAGQQWYSDLIEYDGTIKTNLAKSPLVLANPGETNLWEIVKQVHHRHGKPLADEFRAEVLEVIEKIDPFGRPLFVILTALAIARGDYNREWTRDGLLRYHLDHDERIWRKETDKDLLFKHKNLLALATMVGGLTGDDVDQILDKKWSLPLLPDLNELTQGIDLYGRMAAVRPDGTYAALEPDPYGEFYVLEWLVPAPRDLAIKKAAKEFINWAWANKPDKISAFASRAFTTYFGNECLAMLYPLPPDDCSEDTARHRAGLVVDFTYLLQQIPELSFKFFDDIKNCKGILQYSSSQLVLANSATNLINGLGKDPAWPEQANSVFKWLRDEWVGSSDDPALRLELANSATNLINGLSEDPAWRQQANSVFKWLRDKWVGSSNDPALRLELAKSAQNLIGGLSKDPAWRKQANSVFKWLRDKWVGSSDDPALRLALAKSATNLIGGLGRDPAWPEQANIVFEWFETFAVAKDTDAIFIEFVSAAYNLMLSQIQSATTNWKLVEEYFGRVQVVLSGKPLSADLLYEVADCLRLTLQSSIWAKVLHNPSIPPEQAQQFRTVFWSRVTQLSEWIEQFKEEKRWQNIAAKVGNNQPLMALIQEYGELINGQEPDELA